MLRHQKYSKTKKMKIILTLCIFIFYSTVAGSIAIRADSETRPLYDGYVQDEWEQISSQLKRLFDDFRKLDQESSRKILDVRATVQLVGPDRPEDLFEWVRDNTYFIPYKGLLRSSDGVLMDKLGNSLDRAILLHDLLSTAGYEVRLANGILSNDQAKNVLRKTHIIPKNLFSPTYLPLSPSDQDLIERYSREYNIDKNKLLQAVKEKESYDRQLMKNLSQKVDNLTAKISRLIIEPKNAAVQNDKLLESIQDHWWIQVNKESEWIDLDPTLPDSAPGETLTDVGYSTKPDSLDENLFHKVTIKIVIEQRKKDSHEEHVVLSHTIMPSQELGKRIALYHTPAEWPENPKILEENEPRKALENLLLQQKTWTPILQVGSEKIENLSFKNSGATTADPGKKKRPSGPTGIMGGFGRSVSGAKTEAEEEKDSFLTAEWIEYEILSPGQPPNTNRREVFDVVGPAARSKKVFPIQELSIESKMTRSLSLLGTTEILPLCCHLSDEFIQAYTDARFIANGDAIPALLSKEVLENPGKLMKTLGEFQAIPFPMYMLVLHRYHQDNFICTPNIFSYHSFLEGNIGGYPETFHALDIAENKVGVSFDRQTDAFQIRLRQGIRDSVLESIFLSHDYNEDSLSRFLEEIEKNKIDLMTLQTPGDKILETSSLSEDVIVRINDDLARGFTIVVPKKEILVDGIPDIKWFRIHPETGDTLVIGKFGWGQAITSYLEKVEIITQLVSQLVFFGNLIKCVYEATNDELTPLLAKDTKEETFYKCIANLACGMVGGILGDFGDSKTPWTKFINQQIIEYIWGNFCSKLVNYLI